MAHASPYPRTILPPAPAQVRPPRPSTPPPEVPKLSLRTPVEKPGPVALKNPEPAGQRLVEEPKRKRHRSFSIGQGMMGFLFVMVVLGGGLYDQVSGNRSLPLETFHIVRNVFVVSVLVLVVVQAFQQTLLHGVLCFFPPYLLLYGLLLADSSALRGVVLAFCVFVGAEMSLSPKNALYTQVASGISGWVNAGNQALRGDQGKTFYE